MVEHGGPTTQDGIYYQNTVAARYLADLLNLHASVPRESVVEVRIEAPSHVDDIVVRYADGHREWVQAKSNLRASGEAWRSLWAAFAAQIQDSGFGAGDRLIIALGSRSSLSANLQALAERAVTSTDEAEWRARLGSDQVKTLAAIQKAVSSGTSLFSLLQVTAVRVLTLEELNSEFQRLDLGTASPAPMALQSHLRDLVGGAARIRKTFGAAPLRRALASDFGADLFEPKDWGLAAYRDTVRRACRIPIPGKGGVSAPASDLIVWPRARLMEAKPDQDFEDEVPNWHTERSKGDMALARFPDDSVRQCILVAGPGFGKSTLISAISARLVATPIIPVEIGLADFAQTDRGVLEFIETFINREFSVHVAWQHLADRGLICVLFDGLDEVPTASRESVIKRIRLFGSRFPDVAWLLTVRDPAAVNGPLDGSLVELLPFDNPEISDLVGKFKTWLPQLEPWKFVRELEAYPDVAKLARIPLFLSIMLGTWTPEGSLPARRSDIIESYLGTLFQSSRRRSQPAGGLADAPLRKVAQAIAFSSLEREEIGLSERQASKVIADETDQPSEIVLAQLIASGVLKRTPSGRLQFPYPIVQEYLAAIHIVDVLPDQVASRIGDVVKRPWAQVLQFALELLPDATLHVRNMIALPDDAFSTGLRLIGRCIANGTHVEEALRDEIGTRLAELWGRAGYNIRERVGRLLVDAYSRPLHPEVSLRLGCSWLLGSGASEILLAHDDPELTLRVIDEFLDDGPDKFMDLRDLEPLFQKVATRIVARVTERAKRQATSTDEFHGLSEFFDSVRLTGEAPPELTELIADEKMPLFLRLAARASLREPPDAAALDAALQGLASSEWQDQSAALTLLARVEETAKTMGDFLLNPNVSDRAKSYLLEHLSAVVADRDERAQVAGEILPRVSDLRHRDILQIYRLRGGDRGAYLSMIDRIEHAPLDVVEAVLASMNQFPEKALGDLALEKLRRRKGSSSGIAALASSALIGLTSRISHDGWNSYAIEDADRHPSWPNWSSQFDEWLATEGLSKVERLRLIDALVGIRPELVPELETIVFGATNPDAPEWDEDSDGHFLRAGMDELRRHRVQIPLELAATFVRARRANLYFAGINAIGAWATEEALHLLIALYKSVERDRRSFILDEMEVVAGRLGVTIAPQDLR